MKPLRLFFIMLPFLLLTQARAQALDDTSLQDSGSGTFESRGSLTSERSRDLEQQQMQQEEEEVDSFGDEEFNQNVDPDAYHIDDEILNDE